MSYLFFDTETTGLPLKAAPLREQPRVVQLGASLFDANWRPVLELSTFVMLPEGMEVPDRPFEVHGISAAMTQAYGMKPKTALSLLSFMASRADVSVAHNLKYDMQLLGFMAEMEDMPHPIPKALTACTMEICKPLVKCPPTPAMLNKGMRFYKAPKLDETYRHFFGEELVGAHDALIDTRACARIYRHLMENNLLPPKAGPDAAYASKYGG